jgi:hypothetical protein
MFFDFSASVDENFKQYDWLITALQEDRANALRVDAFRSLFFIVAAGGLLWFAFKNKLKYQYAVLGIAALVLVDMWTVNKRYLNNDNFVKASRNKQVFTPNQANLSIMQDTEPSVCRPIRLT